MIDKTQALICVPELFFAIARASNFAVFMVNCLSIDIQSIAQMEKLLQPRKNSALHTEVKKFLRILFGFFLEYTRIVVWSSQIT